MRIHTKTVWDIETGNLLEDESYEYSGPMDSCQGGSGIKSGLFANSGQGQGISQRAGANASSLYGTLDPTLTTMATAPQGINPADLAKMKTGAMQTAGGANAGAVGQGSLLSARTKNAGTADAAIAKSGESAGQTLSNTNLGIDSANQELKNTQQQAGLKGLEGLYGTNESEALGGLNESNGALKAAGEQSPFWQKLLMQGLQSGGQAAGAYFGAQ